MSRLSVFQRLSHEFSAVVARTIATAACVAVLGGLRAQSPSPRPYRTETSGYEALQQALLDVTTDTQVLLVASHPDDRWVMPAGYLRFRLGWRSAVLLATRGEGGQNSRGPEIGDDLGRIRTIESEACAAMLGTMVYYLNRPDGGFCRTAQEALRLWGSEATQHDLARLLRLTRPDVVLTTHHPAETHGHDLALLELLPGAVRLAADPAFQTPGLEPFAVKRLLRGTAPEETASVVLTMNELDRLRGKTYRELAYEALLQHRSSEPIQPMATLFEPIVSLRSMADPPSAPEADGLDVGLPSLLQYVEPSVASGLERDLAELSQGAPVAAIPSLVPRALMLRNRLAELEFVAGSDAALRRDRRLSALDRVVLHASSFRIRVEVPDDRVGVLGDNLPIDVHVHADSSFAFRDFELESVSGGELRVVTPPDPAVLHELPRHAPLELRAIYRPTTPVDTTLVFHGDTFQPHVQLQCTVGLEIAGSAHRLSLPLIVPTEVRPAVELSVIPSALLLPEGKREIAFAVRVARNSEAPLHERLIIAAQAGFVVHGSPASVDMPRSTVQDVPFVLSVPQGQPPGVYTLHVRLGELRLKVPLHKVDVSVPDNLRVGLIRGVDDAAHDVLNGLVGTRLHVLNEDELAVRDLAEFDTIVVDVRALSRQVGAVGQAARAAFSRLLEFARLGGRLIVFYHKDSEFNVVDTGFEGAPYPLHIGKGRTTREDAPIEILLPNHPLLNVPNRIRAQDWDGWVQERGLYFPDAYDASYQELISTADPGQPKERGPLLYAVTEKGDYVYCALSLYRQLKSLHPGACRLFANLIATNR